MVNQRSRSSKILNMNVTILLTKNFRGPEGTIKLMTARNAAQIHTWWSYSTERKEMTEVTVVKLFTFL